MGAERAKLDDMFECFAFLDYGLPVEHSDVDVSKEFAGFREYCKSLNKEPGQLTKKELQKYYEQSGKS